MIFCVWSINIFLFDFKKGARFLSVSIIIEFESVTKVANKNVHFVRCKSACSDRSEAAIVARNLFNGREQMFIQLPVF